MMADDGSDYEGVVYWRYGTIWTAIYFDLLKDQEGDNLFEAKAQILDCMNMDGYTYAVGETGKVYAKELELNSCRRNILYTGNDFFHRG